MTKTGSKIYRIVSVAIVVAIAVIIFQLSSQNGIQSAEISGFVLELFNRISKLQISHDLLRTVGHFCEYAVLGFFICNAFFSFKEKTMPIQSIIISFLYAVTDEIHQIFVPERAFQLFDLAVDLSGIATGTFMFVLTASLLIKIKLNKRKTVE